MIKHVSQKHPSGCPSGNRRAGSGPGATAAPAGGAAAALNGGPHLFMRIVRKASAIAARCRSRHRRPSAAAAGAPGDEAGALERQTYRSFTRNQPSPSNPSAAQRPAERTNI